jgi:hypothetical protein
MTKVEIYSENYSGQTCNITFYPDTGGTINIGIVTLPYDYISEYYFGEYELYFPSYQHTCHLIIPNDLLGGLITENNILISTEDGIIIIP